ncbi:MAG: hypothetical protein Kow001_24730 [Acidobacteriota bacterium]
MAARFTVTLDEHLLAEVRRLTGAKSKRETIELALSQLLRRLRARQIVEHAGTVELDWTQDTLRRRRAER